MINVKIWLTKLQLSEGTYSWIHIKDTWSVHLFNGDYLSIPEGTGSCGYLFHEIPCMSYSVWICSFRDLAAVKWSEVFKQFQHLGVFIKFNNFLLIHFNHSYIHLQYLSGKHISILKFSRRSSFTCSSFCSNVKAGFF